MSAAVWFPPKTEAGTGWSPEAACPGWNIATGLPGSETTDTRHPANTDIPRSIILAQDTTMTALFVFFSDTIYVHDTIYLHDTVYLYNTIYVAHDTVYIYDTVYVGGEGVDEVQMYGCQINQHNGCIVVEGAGAIQVKVYDAAGRELNGVRRLGAGKLEWPVPSSGVYLVRIGDRAARRVLVIK